MDKIHYALTHLELILNGLTRGIDFSILDKGHGEQAGAPVCFYPSTDALGLVMPSNSPAVNSLWLPSIALKTPIVMKPGRDEPWTPFRLIQAFIAAGCPKEAFGFYPTDHEGLADILRLCGRALIFGDKSTTDQCRRSGVQVHGPGFSKILIGDDMIEKWPEFIDAGSPFRIRRQKRVNASAVIVPKYAKEIAEAGKEDRAVKPWPVDDPNAVLSGRKPQNGSMDRLGHRSRLASSRASDATAPFRDGPVCLKPKVVPISAQRRSRFNRPSLVKPRVSLSLRRSRGASV